MKNRLLLAILIIFSILFTCQFANAQAINRIAGRCVTPNQNTYGSVLVQGNGDINLVPCVGRNVLINGTAIPSGGFITGSGTANFVPRFTGATALGNTPLSWNGTTYGFNNTTLNSEFTLNFTPNTATGLFLVGDFTTTPTNYLELNQAGNSFTASATTISNTIPNATGVFNVTDATDFSLIVNAVTNQFRVLDSVANTALTLTGSVSDSILGNAAELRFGDVTATRNGSIFEVLDATQQFRFVSDNNLANLSFGGVSSFNFFRTITAGGTTGNQTIDRPAGTVNLAAATTSITVTNSTVSATSIIFFTTRTNDATCYAVNAVPSAGSFVINMSAACTAETSVGFLVTN